MTPEKDPKKQNALPKIVDTRNNMHACTNVIKRPNDRTAADDVWWRLTFSLAGVVFFFEHYPNGCRSL